MSRLDVESVKAASQALRGAIPAELKEPTTHFSEASVALLKFHGTYQQDDRDARSRARSEAGAEKAYSFMIRVKATGGRVPAALWAALDELADRHGNGTLRLTTRQGVQLHGVRKAELRATIADVVAHLGSTLATCGDVVRNIVAPPWPYAHPAYVHAQAAAEALSREFAPRTGAYLEIWQDGESVHTEARADEPIYGATYLPRKFKIAVAVPGDNSVDLYTNDTGIVPIVDDAGSVRAYDLAVGGGLGTTHGKQATFPRLADELGSVPAERLLDAVRAIVIVQRDHGDRTDRRHARLKYLIADRGLDWFRSEVERQAGFVLDPWIALPPWGDNARFGWHAQGDGRWFYGVPVPSGRVRDGAGVRLRSALRALAAHGYEFIVTAAQQLVVAGVADTQRDAVEGVLREHGVADPADVTPLRLRALACPALPTCGLALAEAERGIDPIVSALESALAALGLRDESISLRMTGCPNGCARPYVAEIGIVGQSLDRYQLYLGGNAASTRLAKLWRESVRAAEIAPLLAPLFARFFATRRPHESFGDWSVREVITEVSA
jgi:sulfite reductase (ferredoxin)